MALLNIDDGYGNSLIRIPRGPSRIVLPVLVTPTAATSVLLGKEVIIADEMHLAGLIGKL